MPKLIKAVEALDDLASPGNQETAEAIFDPGPNPAGLLSGVTIAWLNTASYATAEATGAFGLMDYGEARHAAARHPGSLSRTVAGSRKGRVAAAPV